MRPSLADVDLAALSTRARETLQTIALPMSEGESVENLCEELDLSRRALNDRLDELAAELQNQAGGVELPKLTQSEYEALRDSIATHGQLYPILVDESGQVIGGNHRKRACEELGIEPLIRVLPGPLTDDQRRTLALVDNVARRQLPASARRGIALAELVRDPSRSDRAIALAVGMSPSTIGELRRSLEESGQVSRLDTRRGRDGVEQSVTLKRERAEITPTPRRLTTCPECGHAFDPKEGR